MSLMDFFEIFEPPCSKLESVWKDWNFSNEIILFQLETPWFSNYYIPFHTIVVCITLFITIFFRHSSLQPMPEIEHNAPKFQYRIYWKKDKPGEVRWQVRDEAYWRIRKLVIPNQPTYERYKIRVVAQVWSIIQTFSGISVSLFKNSLICLTRHECRRHCSLSSQ